MRKLIIFIIAGAFIACQHGNDSDYEMLSEYFTDSEINQLDSLLNFFGESIIGDSSGSGDTALYYRYLESIQLRYDSGQYGNYDLVGINYSTKAELYKCLDSTLISKMWSTGTVTRYQHNDSLPTVYNDVLFIDPRGVYFDFLDKYSTDNSFWRPYFEMIESSGADLPPVGLANVLKEQDLTKKSNRLILAIYYLTHFSGQYFDEYD